jgi:hypothetical protein
MFRSNLRLQSVSLSCSRVYLLIFEAAYVSHVSSRVHAGHRLIVRPDSKQST